MLINIENKPNTLIQGMAFETYVINVLKDYLSVQKKSICPALDNELFDAYLPDGINDEITEPLHLEIKYLNTNKSGYFRSIEHFSKAISETSSGAVLIIIGESFTQPSIESLTKLAQCKAKRKVYIWDIDTFDNYTKDFQQNHKKYINNPTKAILENAIKNQNNTINVSETQEKLLISLKKKYQNEELTLFLGAGVSIDAGIPLWKDLINLMFSEMILEIANKNHNSLLSQNMLEIMNLAYNNQEESPLAQMRYIRGAFETKEYHKLLHKILYKNKVNTNTKLLKAIAEICIPKRNHIGVRSIITYNFDDLIEKCLKKYKIATNVIDSELGSTSPDKLSIFHVHGYMPSKIENYDDNNELVFSEENYHRIYRDVYCWSNIVQLNYLRETTGLFIGCSLTDPNLRRLLDIAIRNNERPRHYAFLKRNMLSNNDINQKAIDEFNKIDLSLKEKYYASLGLNIIWINEYDEIPQILNTFLE